MCLPTAYHVVDGSRHTGCWVGVIVALTLQDMLLVGAGGHKWFVSCSLARSCQVAEHASGRNWHLLAFVVMCSFTAAFHLVESWQNTGSL